MPIIIWGSRNISSTKGTGEFYCPQCDATEEYTLKQTRPFFTLYFIPIFPIGAATRYVECRGCRQTFRERVLDYEPPSETDRLASRAFEQLKRGMSLQVTQQILVNQGMPQAKAEEMLDQMCDGQPRHCACGQSYHPQVRKCNQCGATL